MKGAIIRFSVSENVVADTLCFFFSNRNSIFVNNMLKYCAGHHFVFELCFRTCLSKINFKAMRERSMSNIMTEACYFHKQCMSLRELKVKTQSTRRLFWLTNIEFWLCDSKLFSQSVSKMCDTLKCKEEQK